VVGPDHPAKSFKELVEWTKQNPEKSNYATSSPAFSLPTELIKMRSGMQGVAINYRSSNESVLGVIGGNVTMTVVDPPPTTSQVQGGQLRALAVTAKQRTRELPDVPTMAEAGIPDVNLGLWSGFFVPAGTPKPIVDKLHRELKAIIASPDVQQEYAKTGRISVDSPPPEELLAFMRSEIVRLGKVVESAGIARSQ